jgi:hypothetical protein
MREENGNLWFLTCKPVWIFVGKNELVSWLFLSLCLSLAVRSKPVLVCSCFCLACTWVFFTPCWFDCEEMLRFLLVARPWFERRDLFSGPTKVTVRSKLGFVFWPAVKSIARLVLFSSCPSLVFLSLWSGFSSSVDQRAMNSVLS